MKHQFCLLIQSDWLSRIEARIFSYSTGLQSEKLSHLVKEFSTALNCISFSLMK